VGVGIGEVGKEVTFFDDVVNVVRGLVTEGAWFVFVKVAGVKGGEVVELSYFVSVGYF